MAILASFEGQINSEKLVGARFIGLGILLLVVAGYVFMAFGKTEFASGLKWASPIIGLLMVTSGAFYRNQNLAIFKEYPALYQFNKQQFLAQEVGRATTLNKGYGKYRLLWLILTVGSLAVILFLPN